MRLITRFGIALAFALALGSTLSAQPFGQNQSITVIDSGTACVTAPTACAIFALDSVSPGVTLSISGTWTGTLTFEGTNNDGIWTALSVTNLATGARVTTTTASGLFGVGNAGLIKIRARATAAITGSALVTAAKGLGQPSAGFFSGSGIASGPIYEVDGTALLPAYSFASEPTLGLWRSSAGFLTVQGQLATSASIAATSNIEAGAGNLVGFTGRAGVRSPANGIITFSNNAATIGAEFKADALPTVGSGFGTSPSVTAGSTALAGSVNVGTGGIATSGVITFGGTAFPSAPFCAYGQQTSTVRTVGVATTTQLTLSAATPWTASDIVSWICISSR